MLDRICYIEERRVLKKLRNIFLHVRGRSLLREIDRGLWLYAAGL